MDRDEVTVDYFQSWIQWAKENNMKLDFNSTSFGHPKSGDLSLANPDPAIREFWIEHTKRCRRIADAMGKAQAIPPSGNSGSSTPSAAAGSRMPWARPRATPVS